MAGELPHLAGSRLAWPSAGEHESNGRARVGCGRFAPTPNHPTTPMAAVLGTPATACGSKEGAARAF
jgi:hypothetical protein